MRCVICRTGTAVPGEATVVLTRGATTVVIKQVPAEVCDTCGEYYLSESVSARVLAIANDALAKGAQVEILGFAA